MVARVVARGANGLPWWATLVGYHSGLVGEWVGGPVGRWAGGPLAGGPKRPPPPRPMLAGPRHFGGRRRSVVDAEASGGSLPRASREALRSNLGKMRPNPCEPPMRLPTFFKKSFLSFSYALHRNGQWPKLPIPSFHRSGGATTLRPTSCRQVPVCCEAEAATQRLSPMRPTLEAHDALQCAFTSSARS